MHRYICPDFPRRGSIAFVVARDENHARVMLAAEAAVLGALAHVTRAEELIEVDADSHGVVLLNLKIR